MPKLPIVSGAEVVRALQRLGFAVIRQRGGHIVMRRGSSGCIVPNHRELKTGMLVGLLKDAGVSPQNFQDAHTITDEAAPPSVATARVMGQGLETREIRWDAGRHNALSVLAPSAGCYQARPDPGVAGRGGPEL